MKKLMFALVFVMLFSGLLAQAPQGITHQAVFRNTQGELLTNQLIGIQVSILQGSAEGTAVYVETHSPTSNAHGLITYVIGQGTPVSGSFAGIDWADGLYFLKTEADPTGETNYTITGTTQFLSVPYALHAKTAERLTGGVSANILPPKAIALEATEVTTISATLNGIVNSEGFLTEVIFEWGETTDYGNIVTAIQSPVKGSLETEVSVLLEGLMAGTTYNYRIIANNAVDVVISDNTFFQTDVFDLEPGTMVDVDGNIYETVVIGEQEWMAENLKTTRYKDGSFIEYPENLELVWIANNSGAYAWYNNDIAWKDVYGALYNWYAVNNSNGLCPAGWRVPNDDDWTQLINFVVSEGFPNDEWNNPNGAGNALKSCRQVDAPPNSGCNTTEHPRWDSDETHSGADNFGFMALPGGTRSDEAQYYNLGEVCYFWSSSGLMSSWVLRNSRGDIQFFEYTLPNWGLSVRCIKDND